MYICFEGVWEAIYTKNPPKHKRLQEDEGEEEEEEEEEQPPFCYSDG